MNAHPLADLLPPMTAKEYAALKADIAANGLATPICTLDGAILDGRHRARACKELGVPIKTFVFDGPDARVFVVSANIHRRHLTAQQRRALIEDFLRATPEKSDRAIATMTNSDHKTVSATRDHLARTGEIPQLTETTGADGKSRPRTRTNGGTEPPEPPEPPAPKRGSKGFTEHRLATIRSMLADGNHIEQIAAHVGVDRKTIPVYCKQHGIEVPDWALRRTGKQRPDVNRIVTETINALVGAAHGLQILKATPYGFTQDEATDLLNDALPAMREINRMMTKLREVARA